MIPTPIVCALNAYRFGTGNIGLNENWSKMEELSVILDSKQTELDQKDDMVKKIGEYNDVIDRLKSDLASANMERERLEAEARIAEQRIEEMEIENREKYEFESQRSGTPPGMFYR